jgi:DNA polymerase/3'-5' exonuclease PolX
VSEGARIPLAEAEALAAELVDLLAPFCQRLEIVGSIRRRKPDVGDIELLAIPILDLEFDLFGDATGAAASLLDDQCLVLLEQGTLAHRLDKNGRSAFGSRYKRLLYKGVGLDLFSCLPPAQWGVLSVIRTGSSSFAHRLVSPTERGGWMPPRCHISDGALWRDGQIVETREEAGLFREIGRDCIPPELREAEGW